MPSALKLAKLTKVYAQLTFDGRNVRLLLRVCQVFRLEPICNDQLSRWPQELVRVFEEEFLIRHMTQCFRDPDAVESRDVGCCGEVVAHLLSVKLDEAHSALANRRISNESRSFNFLPVDILTSYGRRLRHLDLFSTDGDPCNSTCPLLGQIS